MPKADINTAYDKFSTILKSYRDRTANFMKDGVFIANSNGENGVDGLRSQGFVLNLAAVLYDDSLHLGYENGDKSVDLYFIPALNKIEVMPYGFDEYGRHQQPTKIFNVSGGIEKFAEFIESLPNYRADEKRQCSMSKKKESLKIRLHENNGSYTHNVFTIFSVSVDIHQAFPDNDESPNVSNGRNFKELVEEQYDSLSQALTAVDSTHIFARPDWTATEYRFGILRLEAVVLVGKRNEPAYGDDVEAWKRGEKPLWNAHYKVGIRCEQSTTLPNAELTSELDDMAIEHSF